MSSGGYKIPDQAATYFVSFAVVGWIDVLRENNTEILLKKVYNTAS